MDSRKIFKLLQTGTMRKNKQSAFICSYVYVSKKILIKKTMNMATFISICTFVSLPKMGKLNFLLHSVQKEMDACHILCALFNCV